MIPPLSNKILGLCEAVDGTGIAGFQRIVHLDESGVLKEINVPYFHAFHLEADTLLQIGYELFPSFRHNEFDAVIENQFGRCVLSIFPLSSTQTRAMTSALERAMIPTVPPESISDKAKAGISDR